MRRSQSLRAYLTIWTLAFGYFAFYVPYSALTKALTKGWLPGTSGGIPGLLILPATVLATTGILLAFLILGARWAPLERRRFLGMAVPAIRWQTFGSGVATAVIIATTTLNYTFAGLSILLALLLMRGGVLILAPIVDRLFGRPVDTLAWLALVLSFLAIGVAFSEIKAYDVTPWAALNIAAYLGGYVCRLNLMSLLAKSADPAVNRRYFAEETLVAAVALTAIPALFALVLPGDAGALLREGFTAFLARDAARPALLIGGLYACLFLFGTGIYLDAREHTFCIPLNRCASLLSGVVASFALSWWLGAELPSRYQLAGAGIIMVALVALMASTALSFLRSTRRALQRVFLFVCGGNTSRSPMAQAICTHEIARRLGLSPETIGNGPIRALSAGLSANPGRPFTDASIVALRAMGVLPHAHASRPVTAELVAEAELVFCMTEDQRRELVARFPKAADKIHRLDPDGDIDDPSGRGEDAYRVMAARLQDLIRRRLPALGT